MLHRAATSAYSWWWASHIRTKQSKWLEQNLQDMEEKVKFMLKIIEQEGDSFAKRAEMYYKKRPELIGSVEESYKSYRALAERYDHLSKDLQSANRTIATAFPEHVQLAMESDDDDSSMGSTAPSPERFSTKGSPTLPKYLPKAPKLPKQNAKSQSMLASRREQLRRNLVTGSGPKTSNSGLSKEEAISEIDTLQKSILGMQTEKEFIKSTYESALAMCLELESRITESQNKVCVLQDEFGVGTVIEDHEARSLMAATALKSCSEALIKLQQEQNRSIEEVKQEYERIKEAHDRLEALKKLRGQSDKSEEGNVSGSKTFQETLVHIELEEGENVDALREKIREQLRINSDSVFTEPEMADKIDDLVEKIVGLEIAICSQKAIVKRLREEIDALLGHIKNLEDEKQSLSEGSAMSKRLRDLEEELAGVKRLNKIVEDKKKNINAEITEAGCNLNHLQQKLPDVKPDEEGEFLFLSKDLKAEQEAETPKDETEKDMKKENLDTISEPHAVKDEEEEEEEEKPHGSKTAESNLDIDLQLEDDDGLNWRQLYLNNIEHREKILVEEYTIIFRDYKDMKMKLNEVEKKHRDDIFELASHIRELRSTLAAKDEEIQMLREKLRALQINGNDMASSGVEDHACLKQEQNNGKEKDVLVSDTSHLGRKPLFHHIVEQNMAITRPTNDEDEEQSPTDEADEKRVKINLDIKPISRTEGKFRGELDNLMESNLDFWLRFSTTFHQIQKFQNSIKDLQDELRKLKESQKKGGSDKLQQVKSDARPIYKHLREIETELTLWLEHSTVFQTELTSRFTSLNNIQDEIIEVSSTDCKDEDKELSDFQAAKFQGEIMNMKQENSKVAEELQAGLHRVKSLKAEVGKVLLKLDKEFGFSESRRHGSSIKNPFNKPKIPLHSFLFGVKLKKQKKPPTSIFACVSPALEKQDSFSFLSSMPE